MDITTTNQIEESSQRYFSLIEQNPDGIYSLDCNGKLTEINGACEKILGYSKQELLTMNFNQVIEPNYLAIADVYFKRTLEGNPQIYETVCIHKNGQKVPLEIKNVPMLVNGDIIGVYGIAKDISREKQTLLLLEENEEKYRSLFDNNLDAIVEIDLMGNYKDCNKMTEILTGYSKEELIGMNFASVMVDDIEKVIKDFSAIIKGKPIHVEQRIKNKFGHIVILDVTAVPIIKQGEIAGVFSIAKDVTEKYYNQKRIKELAFTDQLTGLPNRNWFYHELKKLKENEQVVSIFSVDFDGFKYVNDTFGHKAGDTCLKICAARLKDCLGENDKIARVGGDEFIIISQRDTEDEVSVLANRIIRQINHPFHLLDNELFLTLSIGISINNNRIVEIEELTRQADLALLLAKKEGRNNFQFFTEELSKEVERRVQLERALRTAIEKEEFRLYYQPQVDIQRGKLVGLEALLRWNPSFGPVSPAEFIPIAEETGLILPIGEWVIKEACCQIKSWETQGLLKVKVSVNVSARQFKDPEFAKKVKKIIRAAKVDPKYLEIEITESIMLDVVGALEIIKELKAMGLQVAMDDFGVGYSSLSVINDVEIDTLKIDKSFIDHITTNERTMSLVKVIISSGKNLNARVVVEGVEVKEQVDALIDYSVIVQGFYYSRPLPPEQLDLVPNKKWGQIPPVNP